MRSIGSMTRLELAAFVAAEFRRRRINKQAVLVASSNDVDLAEIERWYGVEGKGAALDDIKRRLTRGAHQDKSSVCGRRRR